MSCNGSSAGKVMGAFLVGLAAGTATGILIAPEKGDKTRKKLKASASDWEEEIEEKVWKLEHSHVHEYLFPGEE